MEVVGDMQLLGRAESGAQSAFVTCPEDIVGVRAGTTLLHNKLVVSVFLLFIVVACGGISSRGIASEGAPPASSADGQVSAFLEDISFGLPTIKDDYKHNQLSSDDIRELFAPFRKAGNEVIKLTEAEGEELRSIAAASGQVGHVNVTRPIRLRELEGILGATVGYYFEYNLWGPIATSWSLSLVDARKSYVGAPSKEQKLELLIRGFENEANSPGICQGIIGMADRESLALQPESSDCSEEDAHNVRLSWEGDQYRVAFPTFSMALCDRDDDTKARCAVAEQFGRLISRACFSTLARVFRVAGETYTKERVYMGRAIDTWNRILASRRSSKLRIRVAVSNVKDADLFVRTAAKLVVGPKDGSSGIEQVVSVPSCGHTDNNFNDSKSGIVSSCVETGSYVTVKNRGLQSILYEVALSDAVGEQLHGAFLSGMSYARVGVVAISGSRETVLLTQAAPFSEAVKRQDLDRIRTLPVSMR